MLPRNGGAMKKLLILTTLSILAFSASAFAFGFGAGAYGGATFPVVQEDQGNGTIFGLKGKFGIVPGIVVEPNIGFTNYGDADFSFGARPGSKVTSFTVDALLGSGMGSTGLRMYGILGLGYFSVKRDFDEDANRIGWSTGLGFEIGVMPAVGIDIRGRMDVVSSEGGGSKKSAAVCGGLNYYFGL